jgi:hypothetical protein
MNIPSEAVTNLVGLGYTSEEARFLYIVAIHSGYFTHRQFLEFSGTKPGKHSQKFLMKLLAETHATFHVYPSGGRVYHIFSRKVFGAIGHDDLRTRRKHQLEYIKTRLVTLDFVLGNQECQYLGTEADKLAFFEKEVGIGLSILPSKVYRSNRSSRTTVRYFVDRFPIFLRDCGAGNRTLFFTYVDWGAPTLRGFVTHLESYASLLRSIPRLEFHYLAPTDRFFRTVQAQFSRIVLASKEVPSRNRILGYFDLRKRWEAGERVSAADVVLLNAGRSELRTPDVEQQYANWRAGLTKDEEVGVRFGIRSGRNQASFEARICGQSLSVFQRPNANYG